MRFMNWNIPIDVLHETQQAFRRGSHEVFVLWTAPLNQKGSDCQIKRCVVPEQRPGVGPSGGVYVHIAGEELSRVQFNNFDNGEKSVVQLHTHPGSNVRMSKLDRKWEVVNHIGALSIIVPFYGVRDLVGFHGVNVYEREPDDWRLWTPTEVAKRLAVV